MLRFVTIWVALLSLLGWLNLPPTNAAHIPNPPPTRADSERPTIILFMADGMGEAHAQAGSYYLTGQAEGLSFQALPHRAMMGTNTAVGEVTDSAASATAVATGHKVSLGVVSRQIPGDGSPLTTILELRQNDGWRTGLVTTSFVTDASLAAFAAHVAHRTEYAQIATDYLEQTRPHLLMGGGGFGLDQEQLAGAGYTTFSTQDGMWSAVAQSPDARLAGLFGTGHMPQHPTTLAAQSWPRLPEMTAAALSHMSYSEEPFFLLIEQQATDAQSHANNLQGVVWAVIDLHDAVTVALEWAEGRNDVLLIVMADHECGALDLLAGSQVGELPEVRWGSANHSGRAVPVYAWGKMSGLVQGEMENNELFAVLNFDTAVLTNHNFLPLVTR